MGGGNTMGKGEYLACNFYWALIALIGYQNFFPQLVRGDSWKGLWLFALGVVAAGVCLTWKNRRNFRSVPVNVLLPLELHALSAVREGLAVACIAAAVLGLGWLVLVLRMNPRKKETRGRIWRHGIAGGRTVFVWVFALCCLPLLLMDDAGTVSSVEPVGENTRQEHMAQQHQMLRRFREQAWKCLTEEEKLEALQTVADMESLRLGLPQTLTVRMDTLQEGVAACYNDSRREIRVSDARMASADPLRLLESICHETYHAYQYRLCDAWNAADPQYRDLACFADAAVFEAEFADYISGTEDPEGYYKMRCESTAREYALTAVREYAEYIRNYS